MLPRLAVLSAVFAALSFAGSLHACHPDRCGGSDFVGTYLYDGAIVSGAPGLPVYLVDLEWQAVMSLHADGTATIRHSFGPPNVAIEPALGVWKRTGKNSIKVVYLFFLVPRRAAEDTVAEQHIQTGRVTMDLTLDRRHWLLEGRFVNEVFLAAQDPLDPSQAPAVAVHGTIANARKLLPVGRR